MGCKGPLRSGGRPGRRWERIFSFLENPFRELPAERLAALDAEQQRWQDRLSAYRAERDALIAEVDLGPGAASRACLLRIVARRSS